MPTQWFVDARRNQNPIIDADASYFQDARRREIFALDARRVHKNGSRRQTPNPINLPQPSPTFLYRKLCPNPATQKIQPAILNCVL